jgi:hypothetical protein
VSVRVGKEVEKLRIEKYRGASEVDGGEVTVLNLNEK